MDLKPVAQHKISGQRSNSGNSLKPRSPAAR
jgi:hypothetical protein